MFLIRVRGYTGSSGYSLSIMPQDTFSYDKAQISYIFFIYSIFRNIVTSFSILTPFDVITSFHI